MRKTLKYILISINALLYISFMTIDLFRLEYFLLSDFLKYSSIALCLLLVALQREDAIDESDYKMVFIALCATLISDYFLLFTQLYTIGITIFCTTHLIYIKRYNKKAFKFFFGIYLIILSTLWVMEFGQNGIYIAGACYAILIIAAAIFSFRSDLPQRNRQLASTGMILFILCDISLLLQNILPYYTYQFAASVGIWFFYLPSQMCITMSVNEKNSHTANKI